MSIFQLLLPPTSGFLGNPATKSCGWFSTLGFEPLIKPWPIILTTSEIKELVLYQPQISRVHSKMVTLIPGYLFDFEDLKHDTLRRVRSRCSTLEIHLRTKIGRRINALTRENEDIFYGLFSPVLDELELSYEWKASKDNSGCMATIRPFMVISVWKELHCECSPQPCFISYKFGP